MKGKNILKHISQGAREGTAGQLKQPSFEMLNKPFNVFYVNYWIVIHVLSSIYIIHTYFLELVLRSVLGEASATLRLLQMDVLDDVRRIFCFLFSTAAPHSFSSIFFTRTHFKCSFWARRAVNSVKRPTSSRKEKKTGLELYKDEAAD